MPDLLLELFSEEIPARMQADAITHLQSSLVSGLQKAGFKLDAEKGINAYVTPRRLAVWIRNLPTAQPDVSTELKGPKMDAPDAALQGFLKKNGLSQKDLTQKDGIYFATVHQKGKPTADVLKALIEETMAHFPWPKSMCWGSGDATWVRPLHSILCILDGKVIPVTFAGIKAGNVTYGHRFLAPKEIVVKAAADYEKLLEKANVLADRFVRKTFILEEAEEKASKLGLELKKDEGLLEEVTGLVEWPVLMVGTIDAKYMDLPKEVLVSEMRSHQKYFALQKKDGTLADKFLITANTDKGEKNIIAGNERVLRARLADGRFFWDQDRKRPLNEWAEKLSDVTFHAKLGTVAEKVSRIQKFAVALADHIPGTDNKLVARAAELCKADLVTGMVGEFPELQGVMGRYYARKQNEKAEVADAICDHYKPQGPNDSVPKAPVTVCVALADKLDTLISMFAIGEKPTGSKDPFALRRAALGVIRIILENNVRLPLKPFFANPPARAIALHKAEAKLAQKTEAALRDPAQVGKYVTVNESAFEDMEAAIPAGLVDTLYDFFCDRLVVQLKEQGIRHDVIKAVITDGDDDLVRICERAKALQAFLGSDDGRNLLAAYKRAANILTIEEKKDKTTYNTPVDFAAFKQGEEQVLKKALSHTADDVNPFLESENYTAALSAFSMLRGPVDTFFDKILVNDSDPDVRKKRLCLLSELRGAFERIAGFALIEGEAKEQKKAA